MKLKEQFKIKPTYLLLSDFIKIKIKLACFPRGSYLPDAKIFMQIFRINLPDTLKALMHLEKEEIAKVVEGSKMKVLKGKEKDACPAEPWNIYNVRKDIADILDLASLLTPLALKRAWKQLDKAHLGRHVKRSDNKSQLQRIICLDEDLHGEILRKCDNPQLTNCLDDIVLQMNFYKQVYLRPFVSQIPESGILIEKTLNAIFEDDYKQARQSLHHHYVCLKNELYAELENILNF